MTAPHSGPPLALVVGAAGAIGSAASHALLRDGWRLALVDIDHERLEAAASALGAGDALAVPAEPSGFETAFRRIEREAGVPVAYVDAAGVGVLQPIFDIDRAAWGGVIDANLTETFFRAQMVARAMAVRGDGGALVFTASVSGLRAGYGRAAYGASKAALIHLVRQLAVELAPHGVRANAVAPGPVESPLARAAHPASTRADYLRSTPMGRYVTPDEVADVAAFLVSSAARGVTGQTLPVDGGWSVAGVDAAAARGGGAEGASDAAAAAS